MKLSAVMYISPQTIHYGLVALASVCNEAAEDLNEQDRVAREALERKDGDVRFDPKGKPDAR